VNAVSCFYLCLEVILYRVNLLVVLLALGSAAVIAQQSASPPPPPLPAQHSDYAVRPPADPAVVQRGRSTFSANCSFCHGSDARGGEQGPNLIRSQTVLDDKDGELIAKVVQNGRPDKGMPKFDLTLAEIQPIATFLHSVPVGGRAATTGTVNALVGDAQAGKVYFDGPGKCTTCHTATGDLAGIGGRFRDVRALQGAMLSGDARGEAIASQRKTVTVTLPSGEVVLGRLDQIDDFVVSLTDVEGNYHSYRRNGNVPKVVVKDRLQPHLDMLRVLQDDDIHNLTAYLETLK
jgi:cytochrome c oxidase cbb3-type subunit 3